MRVLLTESDPEDCLFLRDVLLEIGEGRYWNDWVQIEIAHAGSWRESAAILASEQVDLLLLDLDLPDSRGIETFRRAQKVAQDVPVVLLIGAEGASLGLRLIRDGAQDYLEKKLVDCAPLAHAMRNAIERHRLLTAARAASTRDTLTGLLNRSGFFAAAERDRKLAERLRRRWMVLVAEPGNLAELAAAHGEQRLDLVLVEAADHLRNLLGPADLLARIETTRFAISIFDTELEPVEEAWARIHAALLQHRILVGSAIFSADQPATLEALLAKAAMDMAPNALAMRT
ncbi:MAG TPA: response regulator [Bryobacteraceae bacterium]|nr:response regulator [Bryobacteraceae bacterium]